MSGDRRTNNPAKGDRHVSDRRIESKGTSEGTAKGSPPQASASPQSAYAMPPNRGNIGTIIHWIVLHRLSANLIVVGLSNQIELLAPGGSKRVWSDADGYIDLTIYRLLDQSAASMGRFIAELYELKPNNPSKFRTDYIAEVEHYAEHFPSYGAVRPVSRAVVGKSLTWLELAHPLVFETIVIENELGAIFISFGPAKDQRGPVDGLLVYNWSVQRKRRGDRSILEQRMVATMDRLRVRLNQTAEAQAFGEVRMQLAAGAIIVHSLALGAYAILSAGFAVAPTVVGTIAGATGSAAVAGGDIALLSAAAATVANDNAFAAAAAAALVAVGLPMPSQGSRLPP